VKKKMSRLAGDNGAKFKGAFGKYDNGLSNKKMVPPVTASAPTEPLSERKDLTSIEFPFREEDWVVIGDRISMDGGRMTARGNFPQVANTTTNHNNALTREDMFLAKLRGANHNYYIYLTNAMCKRVGHVTEVSIALSLELLNRGTHTHPTAQIYDILWKKNRQFPPNTDNPQSLVPIISDRVYDFLVVQLVKTNEYRTFAQQKTANGDINDIDKLHSSKRKQLAEQKTHVKKNPLLLNTLATIKAPIYPEILEQAVNPFTPSSSSSSSSSTLSDDVDPFDLTATTTTTTTTSGQKMPSFKYILMSLLAIIEKKGYNKTVKIIQSVESEIPEFMTHISVDTMKARYNDELRAKITVAVWRSFIPLGDALKLTPSPKRQRAVSLESENTVFGFITERLCEQLAIKHYAGLDQQICAIEQQIPEFTDSLDEEQFKAQIDQTTYKQLLVSMWHAFAHLYAIYSPPPQPKQINFGSLSF
jgi:hypothetical protein